MTYLKYGSYPQTVVTDKNIISNLDSITDVDSNGYYSYDNDEYAKLVADSFNDSDLFLDDVTELQTGETYYFKVEPIKWRVIYENEGTYQLLSEYILDEHEYDDSSNNYMDSEIREWLNDDFYKRAFTDKSRIQNTLVDNSAEYPNCPPNQYACEDTNDNIFLLSYADVLNEDYGFSSEWDEEDGGNRKSVISDYALASGCCQLSKIFYPDNCGLWWLRSPLDNISDFASSVWDSGDVCLDMVYSSYEGVRPSLVISK